MRSKAALALLETQKNTVFRLVEQAGFDPGDFQWSVVESPQVPRHTVDRLTHMSSEYFFAFDQMSPDSPYLGAEDRVSFFSPGPDKLFIGVKSYGWESQLELVTVWLSSLRNEVEAVSLWDTFGREITRDLATANFSNRPLNSEQKQQIDIRIKNARVYLKANVDDRETLKRVEKRLDDLHDASKRLGVKDFAMTALGILMTIAADAGLSGHQAQELVNLFFKGVHALLG